MNKKIAAATLMLATIPLTGCGQTAKNIFNWAAEQPLYTGTVINVQRDDTDSVNLVRVSLNKSTVFNYYIPVTDEQLASKTESMYVQYKKDAKEEWLIDGDKVTNHGYTFINWVTASTETASSYVETTTTAE